MFYFFLVPLVCHAQPDIFGEFEYRNFSPTRVSTCISDVSVPENPDSANLYTIYTAARHGGVWKSTNNGVTFQPVTDDLPTTSIGAIEAAPSNQYFLWVGTSEASNARSAHAGKGVYKSTDGGDTWDRLGGGLPEGNVGRIGIDLFRSDPDIIYAVVENLNPKPGYEEPEAFDHMRDPYFDRLIGGELYRSADAGEKWIKMNHDTIDVGSKAAYSFNQILVDPMDDRYLYINNISLQSSTDLTRNDPDKIAGRGISCIAPFPPVRSLRLLQGSSGWETMTERYG
jgi:hypothetical protein